MTETTTTTTGPITLDDVRAALGDTDPFSTNAGALQRAIGRGSNATVQKHLETIRSEVRPPVEIAPGTIPKAPADAIESVWAAAFTAAQVMTLSRLEKVTSEREQLTAARAQLEQDLAGQGRVIDEQTALLDQATVAMAKIQAAHIADVENAKADQAATAAQLERVKTELERVTREAAVELERVKAAAAAAAAIAQRDAQIAAQAMQTTIDNLNAQVHQRDLLLAQVHAPAPQGDQK